jgi:chromosome segregation ATPase
MSDYNLTLFEACELLNRSKKSISRYIRRGLLHPQQIKSQQGTLEYRFSKADLEAFKLQETQDKTRQETGDTPDETRQSRQDEPIEAIPTKTKEIKEQTRPAETDKPSQAKAEKTGQDGEVINLLKETTGLLKDQLAKKDEQIKDLGGKIDQLIERDRETNILIGQLQSKVLMLEQPKETIISEYKDETSQATPDKTGQDKPAKPLKEKKKKPKKTKQAKPKEKKTADKPKKKGFWSSIFK